MDKEKIVTVYEVPEFTEGDPFLRIPCNADKAVSTMRVDRETGEFITLWEEKIRYPYRTLVSSKLIVKTDKREFSFKLKLTDDGGYNWNGSNIPIIFWTLLCMSKDSPYGWIASKWHDNLLQHKKLYLDEIREKSPYYTRSEYRRFTSLVFRQLLINAGVNVFKASLMSWLVDIWQMVSPKWGGIE